MFAGEAFVKGIGQPAQLKSQASPRALRLCSPEPAPATGL